MVEKGGLESHEPRKIGDEATCFSEVLGKLTQAGGVRNREIHVQMRHRREADEQVKSKRKDFLYSRL